MIFDRTTRLSDMQAITVTAPSTHVLDLGKIGTPYGNTAALKANLGLNHCIPFLIQVTEAFAAAGAATLTVTLEVDDNEAFSSPKVVWTSPAFALAVLKPGANLGVVNYIPSGTPGLGPDERYFRLNYTVGTGPMTAGKITAGVVAAVQTQLLNFG